MEDSARQIVEYFEREKERAVLEEKIRVLNMALEKIPDFHDKEDLEVSINEMSLRLKGLEKK
jgi:hypothetical protein